MSLVNNVKDGDKIDAGLFVASAYSGVLAILAVAAVIVCCRGHRYSEQVEEEEEGKRKELVSN